MNLQFYDRIKISITFLVPYGLRDKATDQREKLSNEGKIMTYIRAPIVKSMSQPYLKQFLFSSVILSSKAKCGALDIERKAECKRILRERN